VGLLGRNFVMLKRSIATGLVAALALVAFPAAAKKKPAEAPHVYQQVDFNIADDPENILFLDLSNGKRVAIRLMPDWAPNHVARIKELTRAGFYDGVKFHRVIEGFMAQTGDPTGTGRGGSELPDLKAEFNPMPHLRGSVSMAHAASDDSANSQFFIMFYPRMTLDRQYTNFGRVIAGMDAIDEIHPGEPPADPTIVVQASIAADNKPQKFAAPVAAPASSITADMLSAPQASTPPKQ
jgi:cyclophilin family peptidyl-prolyl cis-trans isomerase